MKELRKKQEESMVWASTERSFFLNIFPLYFPGWGSLSQTLQGLLCFNWLLLHCHWQFVVEVAPALPSEWLFCQFWGESRNRGSVVWFPTRILQLPLHLRDDHGMITSAVAAFAVLRNSIVITTKWMGSIWGRWGHSRVKSFWFWFASEATLKPRYLKCWVSA